MNNNNLKYSAAARISSMQNEKFFLEREYFNLKDVVDKIKQRLDLIDKLIIAERKSVEDLI